MKPIRWAVSALLIPAATQLLPLQETPAQVAPQGGLQRVQPAEEQSGPPGLAQDFAREFRREQWLARLGEADLERRERSFDALLKRAQLDPLARAFLEELARDPQGGELAWTARLALRELGRVSFPLQGFPRFVPGNDPLGMAKRMESMLRSLAQQQMAPLLDAAPVQRGARGGRSVHIEQRPEGARVHVTETVDGEEQTRHFEGPSLAEILRLNPELARELGGSLQVEVEPGSPLDLRLDLGRFPHERFIGALPDQVPGRAPQGRSHPIITDRLGVIVRPLAPDPESSASHGLMVERSYPETYAYLLGVRAGDVLLELNGTSLRTSADIETVMGKRGAEDPLTLVWLDELGQRQQKAWQPGERR